MSYNANRTSIVITYMMQKGDLPNDLEYTISDGADAFVLWPDTLDPLTVEQVESLYEEAKQYFDNQAEESQQKHALLESLSFKQLKGMLHEQ